MLLHHTASVISSALNLYSNCSWFTSYHDEYIRVPQLCTLECKPFFMSVLGAADDDEFRLTPWALLAQGLLQRPIAGLRP